MDNSNQADSICVERYIELEISSFEAEDHIRRFCVAVLVFILKSHVKFGCTVLLPYVLELDDAIGKYNVRTQRHQGNMTTQQASSRCQQAMSI